MSDEKFLGMALGAVTSMTNKEDLKFIKETNPEFYDPLTGEPVEDWNVVIQDNFGYKIPGEYRQYLPYFTDEVGLREQLNTKGWEQEKLRKSFQAIQNNNDYRS